MPAVPYLRGALPVVTVTVLVVVLLGAGARVPAGPPGTAPLFAAVSGNGACPGEELSAGFSGNLSIEGGPLPASATSGVTVSVSYDEQVQVNWAGNETLASLSCGKATTNVTTNASGGFSGSVVPPPGECVLQDPSGEKCWSYSAPFVALGASTGPPPAGYSLKSRGGGATFALVWAAGLASVALSPSGPVAPLSAGGALTFHAEAESANGSASPFVANYTWSLSGAGLSFAATPSGPSATVVAGPDATNGSLSVSAGATVGSDVFETGTETVDVNAVATEVESVEVGQSTVDARQPVPVTVTAQGALGYVYSATVDPGLGAPNATVACSTVPDGLTTVTVGCSADVSYPSAGETMLEVVVSNSDSSARAAAGPVMVVPELAVDLVPAAPTGYVGVPLALNVVAANGTGATPYVEACLAPGAGTVSCETGPGPEWSFAPVYSKPGAYSAQAWLLDAAGFNASLNVSVEVVELLGVGNLSSGTAPAEAGVPINLTATVSGGALPAELWWNASGLARPIATASVPADGTISLAFRPSSVGEVRVNLTVRDALGAVASASLELEVGPGPVAVLRPEASAEADADPVGRPVPILWQAFDALGDPVPTFAASADLVLTGPNGSSAPSWVNASSLGALAPSPEGSFAIPATLWSDGGLRLNLTPAESGPITALLEGVAIPGGAVEVRVTALPDLTHLRLYAPKVALAGASTNRTFWHVSDRFGDPVPGTYLTVQYVGPTEVSDQVVAVGWVGPTETGAWVNYSLPTMPGGVVRLLDPAGDVLVGPVALGAPPVPPTVSVLPALPTVALPLALGSGGVLAAIVAGARRRPLLGPAPNEEAELKRLAEGRGEVVGIVDRLGRADLDAIASAWGEGGPPPDLAEWVAGLVADGTLAEGAGSEGRVVYSLAPPPVETPRVTVDEAALERAVAAREASVREGPGPDR